MDDAVLLVSSVGDIRLVPGQFAVECEAVRKTNSASVCEAMVYTSGQGEAAAPGGGVQECQGLVHESGAVRWIGAASAM